MRRKAASTPVIVNNLKLRTASELTQERRMLASSDFPVNGKAIGTMKGDLLLTETAVNHKQPTSFQKNTGKPKNASEYTAYLGSRVLQNDAKVFNSPTASAGKTTNLCTTANNVSAPTPYITGTTQQVSATTVARSGSDYIRERLACQQAQGEQHIQSELGKPVFKDDTIRKPEYNKQYLALSARANSNDTTVTFCNPNVAFPAVDHAHSVTVPRIQTGVFPRPAKSQIPVFNVPSLDHVPATYTNLPNCFTGKNTTGTFSQGNVIPSKHPRYVERHHGNDLSTMVNGRKPVPGNFNIPNGSPAQLKINSPNGPLTPNM